MKTEFGFPKLVVCAAILNKVTGIIICGARHGDCLNIIFATNIDTDPSYKDWECGFIDQDNIFMTRKEAWVIADKAGQIRRPTGWERSYDMHRPANINDEAVLFSENLY